MEIRVCDKHLRHLPRLGLCTGCKKVLHSDDPRDCVWCERCYGPICKACQGPLTPWRILFCAACLTETRYSRRYWVKRANERRAYHGVPLLS